MSGIKDLVQLKMEKRLLQEQLKNNRNEAKTLTSILDGKRHHKASSLYADALPLDYTIKIGDKTLHDLRPTPSKIKAIPIASRKSIEEIEPVTIPFGGEMERIRHQHLRRTVGKREVNRLHKENAVVEEKKKLNADMKKKHNPKIPPSLFPNRYARGELPCIIEHGTKGLFLSWVCPLENLDYDFYLPIFFDGLQCTDHVLEFLSTQGIEDMLFAAQGHPERIIPCIKNIVRPIRNALSTYNPKIILNVLKSLRQLVQAGEGIGEALTPFYKIFLSPMNSFFDQNKNTGDCMDYAQRRNDDLGESVRNTLELMERTGGANALQAIKFAVPPYQSYKES